MTNGWHTTHSGTHSGTYSGKQKEAMRRFSMRKIRRTFEMGEEPHSVTL